MRPDHRRPSGNGPNRTSKKRRPSASDYLLPEIERLAALPTHDEMLARLHARAPVRLKTPAAEIIRRERESA